MKKRIINYRLKIDNLLANPDKISKEEWKKILQIGRASCREECRSRWSPYH